MRFADADLIGVPLRVTIGKRLEKDGVVEVKRRGQEGGEDVKVEDSAGVILQRVAES